MLIANSDFKAFSRHLWYLTEEMVTLALFSTENDDMIKKND